MDDLIYDAFSIFFQLLQHFAPDYVGDYGFLMIGYTLAGLFILLVLWSFVHILSIFPNMVLKWFDRG